MNIIISIFIIFTIILQIVVGIYGYKILKIAFYINVWKKGWTYFILAAITTFLRRVCELVGIDGFVHGSLSVISSVCLLIFIYYIGKVFITVTKLHDETIFTTVLKEIPVGILIHELDSSIVYSNPMASKILGVSKNKLSGLFTSDDWNFLREDRTPLPIEEYPVNKILKSGKAFTNMIIGINHRKNTLWVLCNAYFINDKSQVVTVFADVSNLKEIEKELQISEDRYKKAFMSSHDGIIISRLSDGLINSVNRTFTLLTGYTEEEIEGKTAIDLNIWKNIEDRNKIVSDLKNGYDIKDVDACFICKDGSDLYGLISASTLTLNNETYIISSVRVISERTKNGRKEDNK